MNSLLMFMVLLLIPGEIEEDIKELNDHISIVSSQLVRLQRLDLSEGKRHKELTDRLPAIELKRAKLVQENTMAELQLRLIQAEKKANAMKLQEVRGKLKEVEHVLGDRLKDVYKKGPMGYSQAFLKESRIEEIISAFYYVEHVTKKDQALFFDFLELKKELASAELEIIDLEKSELEKVEIFAKKKKEMNVLLAQRKREISVLFEKTAERAKLLEKLKQEKKELTELIGQLQSGTLEKGKTPHIPITHYKGKLKWPTNGSVLRYFGVFRDAQFSTKRKQNGIDIAVVKGQAVNVVYGGIVIFSDWFKSYGNLLIIDHGRHFVSFYAHNDTLLVNKGDIVERNQTIALAGDSGSLEGPFLHFEIRESTKAENPLKWLVKRKRR